MVNREDRVRRWWLPKGVLAAMALCCLLAVVPATASSSPSKRGDGGAAASIVKGTAASIAEFPWLAHVTYEGAAEGFECSGTVVAPRLVLTAGHCAVAESGRVLDPSRYHVVTGLADLGQLTPEHVSAVAQVLVDPSYEPSKNLNDAALLVLGAPVSAPAIALASTGDEALSSGGTPISIAGWGLTSGSSTKAPTVLRSGAAVIQDEAYCRSKAKKVTPFYSVASQLCAIAPPRFEVGACHGDSGGPAIAVRPDGVPVQVGIISMADPECRTNIPGVETRVDQVTPWVSSWIAALETGAPAPPVVTPPLVRLPPLTFKAAAYFAYVGLSSAFHGRFVHGRFKELGCRRLEREKVKCEVFWYLTGSVYTGSVTVYYSLPREGALWNLRFRIRKVGAGCWLRLGSAKRCPGTLYHR
jgi:secreted trypsin-like serine protease